MKNYAFVYIFMLYYMHICRVTDATTILVRMTQLNNISWPSRRDYLQKIFSLIYDAKEKTPSLILFFQKNVIELLLEKYFRSGKLIIRALFLQLTSGVDLFFTIVYLTKCIHITAMFLQMELILANAVLQNLNRNISHTCTRKTDNPTSITRYGGQF